MTVIQSRFAMQKNNFYETPVWATEALLRVLEKTYFIRHGEQTILDFNREKVKIWEPSAGNHKIADVLKRHNYKVAN